jgi:hypothetical protein
VIDEDEDAERWREKAVGGAEKIEIGRVFDIAAAKICQNRN